MGRRAWWPVYRQSKYIKAVIAAGDVVQQLGLNSSAQFDVGIDEAFRVDQRVADQIAVRVDDARKGAVRALQQVAIAGTTLRHRGDDVLAHRRAGDDGENLALEAVRGPANTDRLGHVVRRRRDGKRDIVGDLDEFALRQQGNAGDRKSVGAGKGG